MTDSTVLPASSVPDTPTLLAALQLAARAPSVHNTQPWRWEFDGTRLDLFRDDDRLLTSADPDGRQLVISCGAMLHHLRTALAARGWHTDTQRVPVPTRPDLLAAITFRAWPDPPAGVLTRAQAIEHRRTDRLPLTPPPGLGELVHTARMLASPHDVELDVLDDSARPLLAAASEHADANRRYDMDYQTELHWWAGHSDVKEGVPGTALASDAEAAHVPIARKFPSAAHSERRGDLDDQAALLVLSSPGHTVSDWLHVGEALSAVLLECTSMGLATCALTHITELPAARESIHGVLTGAGIPQVVLRVGAASVDTTAPSPTPRRPVSEILTLRDHEEHPPSESHLGSATR
ncbi:Acg family FMN-binding oxidoreductase [Nocardia sp. bgisy134]|uniref:Acg family FMN-binding oxidoreductase n=1 Tax=unclassified Nocardia TaxID=2637762 RepID=UPI003D7225EC